MEDFKHVYLLSEIDNALDEMCAALGPDEPQPEHWLWCDFLNFDVEEFCWKVWLGHILDYDNPAIALDDLESMFMDLISLFDYFNLKTDEKAVESLVHCIDKVGALRQELYRITVEMFRDTINGVMIDD